MGGARLLRRIVLVVTALGVTLAVGTLAAGRMGWLAGERPGDLGLREGKLRGGDARPNWVSSQVPPGDSRHYIAPLRLSGAPGPAWEALEKAVRALPGATVVASRPGYLHAEFASRVLGFVDDAEFALDASAGAIHVRAGARLGRRDFSVNRDRIEKLRLALGL